MIKRKKSGSSKGRQTQNKKVKNGSLKTQFSKITAGLTILVLIILLSAFAVHYLIPCRETSDFLTEKKQGEKLPLFEVYPAKKKKPKKPVCKPFVKPSGKLPKVAIIIDDIGYDHVLADKFIELGAVITLSVLPYSPFHTRIINDAKKKGIEIMLHLPMEPVEYPLVDPGKGALFTSMTADELITILNQDIDSLPCIKGVNNHMGSKMTTVSSRMNQIFSILKKRKLFFIDSRTTHETLCRSSARLLRLPFAKRDVFIDHIQEPAFIRKQIKQLVRIANRQGESVGIAHPHPETYKALSEMLPYLQKRVLLVPASKIVHIVG